MPAADQEVLERLPAAGGAASRELAARRSALAQDPQDLRLALPLAAAYVALGRSEADPRFDGYAQAVTFGLLMARARNILGPWERNPANPILRANEHWKCPGHGSLVTTAAIEFSV